MSAKEPQQVDDVIVDTVVVNYFLAVGRFHLIADLLGGRVQVPRVVFDPDEPKELETEEELLSELRRGLRHHERRAVDISLNPHVRRRSAMVLTFYRHLDSLAAQDLLVPIDLTPSELDLYAQLRDPAGAKGWGLIVPLGKGEAAAVSIAHSRDWKLATDDEAGIKVLGQLSKASKPLRIRFLLRRGVETGLISEDEARDAHKAMIDFGFWDKGAL